MIIILKRMIKLGWLSFSRNKGLNIVTTFILVATISLITSLYLFQKVTDFLILDFQEKVDISVYFREEVLEEEILEVKDEIAKIPEVNNIEFVSKDRALENFTKRHKDDPNLLASLAEVGINPFLASLNIQTQNAAFYEMISQFLEKSSFTNLIEKVDYYQRKPVIEKLFAMTAVIKKTLIIVSLILIGIFFLVTFSAIKLAFYSSKDEISMMKLVGASNWFVRGPFLVQGLISGLLAALISFLIVLSASYFLSTEAVFLSSDFDIFSLFKNNLQAIVLLQLAIGVGLTSISSLIATRKYLKI